MKPLLTILVGAFLVLLLMGQTQHPSGIHEMRSGSIPLTALETTKAITFSRAMPDTNYNITFGSSLAATLSWSTKTAGGFTLGIAVGITGRVDYVAVMNQ